MTPDRWRRVEAIYHAAAARAGGDRATFLAEACAGDDSLRREVESLLAHEQEALRFIEQPAIEVAAIGLNNQDRLPVGRQMGPYTILSLLGAGGMGEVYRAHDTTLGRDVAIKVLPPVFTLDPERRARFEREARLLASLNHPHIATIYGVEDAGAVRGLVLELVEGPTLAERLARRALPLGDALAIARQIADALEAAHDKGIIHRDLKPANVKITPEGIVKVLDFGLAKAAAGDTAADLSQSPATALTHHKGMLGTAAYMSPQQARGQPLDKRTDIWAFGCLLYEMLSGRRAFKGDTSSDAMAAVLEREPDWKALPAATPQNIRTLIERCLEKDLSRRLRDIGDARLEIDQAIAMPANGAPLIRAVHGWRRGLPPLLFGALGVALALAFVWMTPSKTSTSASMRVSAELGTSASLVKDQFGGGTSVVLSRDGALLAFVAQTSEGARPQLYVRYLKQLQAVALSGTDGAVNPFFSPDGQWIAFFAEGKLKKIPATGGGVSTLCDAISNRGGDWADDGTIVFSPDREGASLWRVSSGGGVPARLTSLVPGEVTQRWPQTLAGGKAVLYTGNSGPNGFENANVVVQPLPDGRRKVLVRGAYGARYLSSGHLVYIHDDTLFAAPFDLDTLQVTGQAVRALEGLTINTPVGAAQFTISTNGTLAYLPGQRINYDAPIDWADRGDRITPLRAAAAYWQRPVFSPDGQRLAMAIHDGKHYGNWIYDWGRDELLRLTYDLADAINPVWTPDGQRIVFATKRDGTSNYNLYWQRANGSGESQRLTSSTNRQLPTSVHPDGKLIAFTEHHPDTGSDVMILPFDGDEASGWKPGEPRVFLNSRFSESEPMFSPDGRWLAYVGNESGRDEVYVVPFPGPGGRRQISIGGGNDPAWSRARHELFYGTSDHRIMVVSYSSEGGTFRSEKPRLGSNIRFSPRIAGRNFDVHPDGERFALSAERPQGHDDGHHVTLIFNFFEELRRTAPTVTR
jgi:serine/threonine protein kinase/Tol biopolymer transport system component